MVDKHEVRCYIGGMAYFISAIISFAVGIVVGLYFTSSQEHAARSLKKQLQISKSASPIYEIDSETYHTIYITVGNGNLYCQLLKKLHISVRLVISGFIRWIPVDDPKSVGFHSFFYPIGEGRKVLKDTQSFYIIPNTLIELAVAKRKGFELKAYALGGFKEELPFIGSYNMHLYLFDQDREPLPLLSIENYIQDGEIPA